MITTRVGRRGQITIPREIRHTLQIEEGDRIAFVRRGGDVVLQPLSGTLLDHRGSVPVSEPQDFEKIRREVMRRHGQKKAGDDAS